MGLEEFLLSLPVGFVPWPEIAAKAGVSLQRARHLAQALKERGYPVLLTDQGVGLAQDAPAPQFLLPRLRGRLGSPYRYLGRVTTTQDVLKGWRGAPEGALVVAEEQTRGRGRCGRSWLSPPGNLYLSLLLFGPAPKLLALRVGLALAEAAGFGLLKWPNDLMSPDGRKMGGILIEAQGNRLFVGVGVNVECAPLPQSAALREFRPVRRVDLLAEFLRALEEWLVRPPSAVLSAWRDVNCTLGREVRVQTGKGVVQGVAEALGDAGELLVRTEGGLRIVSAGDVILGAPQNIIDPQKG